MTYKTEFPDFTLDVEIPAEWEDSSWHNDNCPSWKIGKWLKVWVDYADVSDRWYSDRSMPRFLVTLDAEEHEPGDELVSTDDWAAVLAYVNQPLTVSDGGPDNVRCTLAEFLTANEDGFDDEEVRRILYGLGKTGITMISSNVGLVFTVERADLPVAVTRERGDEIEVHARFATLAEAERYVADDPSIDPGARERGEYGIDAPEEMVNPAH